MIKRAYAKINLGLKVVGKRNDNYHDLEMVMVKINLFDTLLFKLDKDIKVYCEEVEEKDNLVYKIACFLKEKYKPNYGIKIIINKRIPIMAGLGGGSSDAATTLTVLNKLWKLNLNCEELIKISLNFGSDIPFFIINKTSFISGRGENISPINAKKRIPLLLIKPNVGFSTKDIFSNVSTFSRKNELIELIKSLENNDILNISNNLVNDLEKALDSNNKKLINDIKNDLISYGAQGALMSGSGSSVFAIFDNKLARNKAYKELKLFYDVYKAEIIK